MKYLDLLMINNREDKQLGIILTLRQSKEDLEKDFSTLDFTESMGGVFEVDIPYDKKYKQGDNFYYRVYENGWTVVMFDCNKSMAIEHGMGGVGTSMVEELIEGDIDKNNVNEAT